MRFVIRTTSYVITRLSFKQSCARGLCAGAMLLSAAACAPSSYMLKPPSPSGMKYEATTQPPKTELSLLDSRRENERVFHSGLLNATLNMDNAPIDPPSFLAANLQREFESRGIPVQVSRTDKGLPRLNLTTFRVQNHRSSGFAPFVTFTYLSADLETPSGKTRFGTFIKRGKVPVWSFDEVVDPTFNQPLSLAVKELASKVANQMYGYRASDKTVDELIKKVSGALSGEAYLDVYALGFTNNPRAIDTLVRLIGDKDEYVRLAAISSLGNLRATSQYKVLRSIYDDRAGLWQDRAMALKAIGDLGTAESREFLLQEKKRWESGPASNESNWTLNIIRLYV